jgi:hypothetical protein
MRKQMFLFSCLLSAFWLGGALTARSTLTCFLTAVRYLPRGQSFKGTLSIHKQSSRVSLPQRG